MDQEVALRIADALERIATALEARGSDDDLARRVIRAQREMARR